MDAEKEAARREKGEGVEVGERRRGGQRQDHEGTGRWEQPRCGRGARRSSPALERPPLEGRARRAAASPGLGSLPGHPPHSPLRPRGGEGAQPGRPSAGSRGTRRRRQRLRSPERALLPWLLWGLAPAAAADWPPSPPTCPGRHVGRKRRVTQRPNGCRGGSSGGGAACPELPRRGEAGGGGRRGRRGPSRSATEARRGPAASCVRLQGGVGRGGRPAAPGTSGRLRCGAEDAWYPYSHGVKRLQGTLLPLLRLPEDPVSGNVVLSALGVTETPASPTLSRTAFPPVALDF
ncbi:translation initiation factor IF-2-like [Ursus arctos]|uniref:translation initiation factor IF-2-like n=1 Tax=Ursus arctos TaxID=9644 RepID=UPI0025471DA4|nr:translation initiation factor IF-2-like [Ursus arctos]